ncbi:hypothetical protein MFFC18_50620 [Mariniblastus fucicola]|uniref:Uncharacterized protein n=1 Tax=Mariniblastus fucicola TaxID=980251 RepID=A0A5B9PHQ9_9BACT|nr:hypothetical protein MFFC18_50620 [Mariniblastus fucicola]
MADFAAFAERGIAVAARKKIQSIETGRQGIEETFTLLYPLSYSPKPNLHSSRAGGTRTHDLGTNNHVVPPAFATFRLTEYLRSNSD